MKRTVMLAFAMFGMICGVLATEEISWKGALSAEDGFRSFSRQSATSELIPVDVEKEYVVSGEFKHTEDVGMLYFCMIPYDKDKKKIERFHEANIPGTETVLAADCKVGATTISVKDGAEWKKVFDKSFRKPYVVFDTDNEGTFKDLPNAKVAQMKKIEVAGDVWTVQLAAPCSKDYAAGTKLRLHEGTGGLMTIALVQDKDFPPGPVKKIESTLSGEKLSGVGGKNGDNAFWKGTKYVRFFLMTLKNKAMFKNVSIREAQ